MIDRKSKNLSIPGSQKLTVEILKKAFHRSGEVIENPERIRTDRNTMIYKWKLPDDSLYEREYPIPEEVKSE